MASPVGSLADATSPRTALAPLVLMPVLSRLLSRTLSEPAVPRPPEAVGHTGGAEDTRPPAGRG